MLSKDRHADTNCDMNSLTKSILNNLLYFRIFLLIICTLSTIVQLAVPFLIGKLFDMLTDREEQAIRLCWLVLFTILIDFLLNWFQNYVWFKLIHKGTALFRTGFFQIVLNRDYAFFTKMETGDVLNRVINDSSLYAQSQLIKLPMLFINVISLACVFIFLIYTSLLLSTIIILLSVLYFLSYLRLNKKLREAGKDERESFSKVMDSAHEIFSGIQTIQIYGTQAAFLNRFRRSIDSNTDYLIRLQKWKSLSQSGVDAILKLIPVAAIMVGIYFLLSGKIEFGTIITFYALLPYIGEPIRNLTDLNLAHQSAKTVEKRLSDLFSTDTNPITGISIPMIDTISFENVSFHYSCDLQLLDHISFSLVKGDCLVITGKSGGGKSTLLKLLLGLIQPKEGCINVNDRCLEDYTRETYLNRIAYMPQDIFLFTGNLSENIVFGENYEEERLTRACTQAYLHDFPLSADIMGFSGGERQRIGLARALMRNADVIILDEPTSSLDQKTAEIIMENINSIHNSGKILIIVSHQDIFDSICNKKLNL